MHMQKMSGFPMRRDFLAPFFIPPLHSVIEKPWPFGTLKRKFHQNLLNEYFEDHSESLLCSSIDTELILLLFKNYDLKCTFKEKFCDFLNLRPSDLNTTLNYILMDNFCPCFLFTRRISINIIQHF